jgi:hypothetical protein
MLHFGQFALPSEKQGSVKRDLIRKSRDQRSHALPPGLSQLATSFIAYQAESFPNRRLCTNNQVRHFLFLLQLRKLYANISVKPHIFHSVSYYADIVARFSCDPIHDGHCGLRPLRPSFPIKTGNCISMMCRSHEHPYINPLHKVARTVKTKEVIQPQVPLRLPCYDFSPVADPRFDSAN